MSFSRLLTLNTIQAPPFLAFSPSRALLAAMARRRRHHPSQGHGSSPAALHQKPRCMTDSRDSIMPVQFSSLPDFDAEPPAVPAPQRVMLHPHRLHISTSRELLAFHGGHMSQQRQEARRISARSRMIRADSPHYACRLGATVCVQLRAGIASISARVAASRAPGLPAKLI